MESKLPNRKLHFCKPAPGKTNGRIVHKTKTSNVSSALRGVDGLYNGESHNTTTNNSTLNIPAKVAAQTPHADLSEPKVTDANADCTCWVFLQNPKQPTRWSVWCRRHQAISNGTKKVIPSLQVEIKDGNYLGFERYQFKKTTENSKKVTFKHKKTGKDKSTYERFHRVERGRLVPLAVAELREEYFYRHGKTETNNDIPTSSVENNEPCTSKTAATKPTVTKAPRKETDDEALAAAKAFEDFAKAEIYNNAVYFPESPKSKSNTPAVAQFKTDSVVMTPNSNRFEHLGRMADQGSYNEDGTYNNQVIVPIEEDFPPLPTYKVSEGRHSAREPTTTKRTTNGDRRCAWGQKEDTSTNKIRAAVKEETHDDPAGINYGTCSKPDQDGIIKFARIVQSQPKLEKFRSTFTGFKSVSEPCLSNGPKPEETLNAAKTLLEHLNQLKLEAEAAEEAAKAKAEDDELIMLGRRTMDLAERHQDKKEEIHLHREVAYEQHIANVAQERDCNRYDTQLYRKNEPTKEDLDEYIDELSIAVAFEDLAIDDLRHLRELIIRKSKKHKHYLRMDTFLYLIAHIVAKQDDVVTLMTSWAASDKMKKHITAVSSLSDGVIRQKRDNILVRGLNKIKSSHLPVIGERDEVVLPKPAKLN